MGVLKLGLGVLTGSLVAVGAGGGAPLLYFLDFEKLFSRTSSDIPVEETEETIQALVIQPASPPSTSVAEQAPEPSPLKAPDSRNEETPKVDSQSAESKEHQDVTSNEITTVTTEEPPVPAPHKAPEVVPKEAPKIMVGEVVSKESAKIKFQDIGNFVEETELTGEWFFLNYGEDDVNNLVGRNFVDIAIPALKDEKRLLKGKDNLMNAKLLFCGKSISGTSADFVNGQVSKKDTSVIKCRALGSDWMYGIIFGRKYGVSFIVKTGSEYWKKLVSCKVELGSSCDFEKIVFAGEKWWSKLIHVAGERERLRKYGWHKWNGIWKEVEKDSRKENFVLGEIFDVKVDSGKNREKWARDGVNYVNCHRDDEEVGRCRMGIADVVSYTLKKDGSSSIWSNKFTPKIVWKALDEEHQS